MLADKVRDLGFNGLSQQNTRPIAQDFGELVADVSWLNQFDDVIFGHGISLLQWRSGGVKHPHDMPPFRFLPSPTFGDSSNAFVEYYNHVRYHESIDNLRPADVYFGRADTILAERRRIKRATIANRRLQHQLQAA